VKLKLAAHRGLNDKAAQALLDELKTSLQATTLSVHDPLGSTLFFRELSLFLEHYIRVGRPSVVGKVSDYYATVETNDRGALYLHGLLWFDANVALPSLIRDMADPAETRYREKVRRFVDDVFTETLDDDLARAAAEQSSKTVAIPEAMRGEGGQRARGKAGFRWVTHRTGPLCTPAFAMTDQKSQRKQFEEVLLNLKGASCRTGKTTRPSFMSLYVQLSRATSWDGLYLFQEPERADFIEPKNVLDGDMREAVERLERRGEETRERFRREHGHKSWFTAWDAIEEAAVWKQGERPGSDLGI
jgi:hypothetical protein